MVKADVPFAIDKVDGRPVMVLERPPDRELVVEDHRVADAQLACRALHVFHVVLEPELRRVRANDHEPTFAVALLPGPDVRQGPQPVDARVRPEVDEHDALAQSLGREPLGVDPNVRSLNGRQSALGWMQGGHLGLLIELATVAVAVGTPRDPVALSRASLPVASRRAPRGALRWPGRPRSCSRRGL